jgi:steroid delta-isomerase-like uncharacterized protein
MPAENKAIIRRLYDEVWNERKIGLVDKLMSPSHALYEPNVPDSRVGPEAYKATVNRFVKAIPDISFAIQDTISEKNKVVVQWIMSGTHKGEFDGYAATNKKFSVEGITIHQVENGKILDSFASWDRLGMMRQLGVEPLRKQNAAGGAHGA